MIPIRLVAKSGAILSPENLLKNRLTISTVESLTSETTSGSPPTAFRTSSESQVLRPFL